MVLEMRRALEEVKSGNSQGYRRLYNATYEEAYCRSLLIIQREDQALEFIKDFYKELFGVLDEAEDAADQGRWFLHRFYQKLRRHYHRLLEKQKKDPEAKNDVGKTMGEMLTAFPLLHRIILVMSCRDDFTAGEISAIYGLTEEKIQTEIDKLKRLLPTLAKDRPESEAEYLGSWKALLLRACGQVANAGSGQWAENLYGEAAKAAGISSEPAGKKTDDFEYFVADPEPEPEKPKKKPISVVEEEPEEEEYDEEDEEEEYDDEDDEYDDDDDDDEDEDDDRYDWDVDDDGKRMVILGVILALVIVVVVGFAAFRLLGNKDGGEEEPVQTEQDAQDSEDKLIVKGGDESFGEEEPEETPEEEAPEEEPVEEPQEEEPQTTIMKVKPSSMNVRSEPNTNCEVVASVKAGDRLEVIGEASEDGWVQVRCVDQDGKEGYAKLENLAAE